MSTAANYEDLLAAIEEHDWSLPDHHGPLDVDHAGHARRGEQLRQSAREAIQAAADEPPADHVRAIPVRRLAAEAPALPPLKMPKLSDKKLNGKRVEELIAAGPRAVLVHTATGLRVVEDVREVQDDPDVVVLADYREAYVAVTIGGDAPLTAAQRILDRELLAITKAAA